MARSCGAVPHQCIREPLDGTTPEGERMDGRHSKSLSFPYIGPLKVAFGNIVTGEKGRRAVHRHESSWPSVRGQLLHSDSTDILHELPFAC